MDRQTTAQFETLFRDHFTALVSFAMKFTKGDMDEAKDIVHKVYIKVWEKYESLPADTNYKSYLYTSVNNLGLNFIRDRKKFVALEHTADFVAEEPAGMDAEELERSIELALNTLPDRCREVFENSRFEGLKYAEIAEKMNISVKTVEAQMSKALKLLKEQLREFLLVAWIFLMNLLG